MFCIYQCHSKVTLIIGEDRKITCCSYFWCNVAHLSQKSSENILCECFSPLPWGNSEPSISFYMNSPGFCSITVIPKWKNKRKSRKRDQVLKHRWSDNLLYSQIRMKNENVVSLFILWTLNFYGAFHSHFKMVIKIDL